MKDEKDDRSRYYKCGLLKWSEAPLTSRISLIVSSIGLVVSVVVLLLTK